MEKKLVLEDLKRMREIMGFSSPSNNLINEIKTLLNEDKDPTDFIKQLTGGKWIDEMTKAGIKATDDLVKQVDVIVKKSGVNTLEELMEKIARESTTTVDELSDEAIAAYIKNDPELIKVIDDFAAKVASDVYDATMSKLTNLQDVFNDMAEVVGDTRIKNIPNNTKEILREPITSRNVNEIETLLADTKKLIDDLPTSNPETEALLRQIDLKQDQVTSFRNRETLSAPTPKPQNVKDPELERLEKEVAKQKEIADAKKLREDEYNELVKYVKDTADYGKLGWLGPMFNTYKKQILQYLEMQYKKGVSIATMEKNAENELKKLVANKTLTAGQESILNKKLQNLAKLGGKWKKFLIWGGVIVLIISGGAATLFKYAYENNMEALNEDCMDAISGWGDLSEEVQKKFIDLGYSCDNRNKDQMPEQFIESISYFEANAQTGEAEKFVIKIGDPPKSETVFVTKPKPADPNTPTAGGKYTNNKEGFWKWYNDKHKGEATGLSGYDWDDNRGWKGETALTYKNETEGWGN